jgi:hypothetical protein
MRAEIAVGVVVAVALVALGCGGGGSVPGVMRSTDSSWIAGQRPLTADPDYLSIALRANDLGARRFALRGRELALIEARRIAARRRSRAARRRAYLRARRRALARYRAALRRAARDRARQRARLRELRRRRAAQLRRLRRQLHVPPGEECRHPRLRQHFDCQAGQLPTKRR